MDYVSHFDEYLKLRRDWTPLYSDLMDYCSEIAETKWEPMYTYDSDGEEDGVYTFYPSSIYTLKEKMYLSRIYEFHQRNQRCCRQCHPPLPPKVKDESEYHRYFLTITWNRKACTEAEWRDACDLFLQSKLFKHGVYAYETGSEGTNPHCHLFAFCQSKLCHNAKDPKHPIEKYKGTSHLKKFNYKYGFIHFQVVPKDNGIENYISKESPKQYFSNTTDSVHPLQPWPSQPEHPEPSGASSAASVPSSDTESEE